MPLDPNMSYSDIIRTEMHHGKPQKQAVAIAYNVKRRGTKDEQDPQNESLMVTIMKRLASTAPNPKQAANDRWLPPPSDETPVKLGERRPSADAPMRPRVPQPAQPTKDPASEHYIKAANSLHKAAGAYEGASHIHRIAAGQIAGARAPRPAQAPAPAPQAPVSGRIVTARNPAKFPRPNAPQSTGPVKPVATIVTARSPRQIALAKRRDMEAQGTQNSPRFQQKPRTHDDTESATEGGWNKYYGVKPDDPMRYLKQSRIKSNVAFGQGKDASPPMRPQDKIALLLGRTFGVDAEAKQSPSMKPQGPDSKFGILVSGDALGEFKSPKFGRGDADMRPRDKIAAMLGKTFGTKTSPAQDSIARFMKRCKDQEMRTPSPEPELRTPSAAPQAATLSPAPQAEMRTPSAAPQAATPSAPGSGPTY